MSGRRAIGWLMAALPLVAVVALWFATYGAVTALLMIAAVVVGVALILGGLHLAMT